jgi:hypothetical protein
MQLLSRIEQGHNGVIRRRKSLLSYWKTAACSSTSPVRKGYLQWQL